jgi:hypothetical protein
VVTDRPVGGSTPPPLLPLWPLTVMFALMPLWWAAGAFYLGWPLLGALLLILLITRGRIPLPPATPFWLFFLALVGLSATQLPNAGALLTFGLRFAFYATALVVGIYVYVAARERGDPVPVLTPLAAFWLGLVALGWLGVLIPRFGMASPMEILLPGASPVTRSSGTWCTCTPRSTARVR